MKIEGIKLDEPRYEVIVFPRRKLNGIEQNIVIKVKAVIDYDAFEKLCPMPVAPTVYLPNDVIQINVDDPKYKITLDEWARNRTSWMIIESLKATENLSWDTIIPNDPSTWKNYSEELKAANFTDVEIGKIIQLAAIACGLNDSKIQEATEAFLAGAGKDQVG